MSADAAAMARLEEEVLLWLNRRLLEAGAISQNMFDRAQEKIVSGRRIDS